MKRLALIALAFVTLQATAQEHKKAHRKGERKERTHLLKDLSPEELATLKTKKMTLHLDLTDAQQKDIYKLNLANAKERKAKMETRRKTRENDEERRKPSKEERYKMMNERLDQQIAQKRQLKSILSKEQFEKFEKSTKHKKMKQRKQRGQKRQRSHRS